MGIASGLLWVEHFLAASGQPCDLFLVCTDCQTFILNPNIPESVLDLLVPKEVTRRKHPITVWDVLITFKVLYGYLGKHPLFPLRDTGGLGHSCLSGKGVWWSVTSILPIRKVCEFYCQFGPGSVSGTVSGTTIVDSSGSSSDITIIDLVDSVDSIDIAPITTSSSVVVTSGSGSGTGSGTGTTSGISTVVDDGTNKS